MLRTHTCGELTKKNIGKKVELCGWLDSKREHGNVTFVNLRDRYGVTQVVFNESVRDLKNEFVLRVKGTVKKRPESNKKLKTGEIEVEVNSYDILNKCDVLPLDLSGQVESTEETRMKYRYLDLRRPEIQKFFVIRDKAILSAMNFMNNNNFIHLETPLLVKATPEGARDYIVPSRVNKGKFYALPQSPQLYKQILMVAGFDRYYQIARCLRDEDLRSDRQPEHTQIDIEMSFIEAEDLYKLVEGLMKAIFKEGIGFDVKVPFKRFTYDEAMNRFGSDKPDIRFGLELVDVSDIMKKSEFGIFKSVIESGGNVKCINAKGCGKFSRKEVDELEKVAKTYHAKGLVRIKMIDKLEGTVVKFFSEKVQKELIKKTEAKNGDLLLLIADNFKTCSEALGQVRIFLRDKLNLIKKEEFSFCWVDNFPLFAWNEEEKRWEPEHHMFTMPQKEFIKDFEKRPGNVKGVLWDLTLNGIELGSGSIRVSDPVLQERIMNFIGLPKKEAHKKFGFLLDAYKYGGPVHGGIGLGFDRMIALMCGLTDIREIILFPKNKDAACLMDDSPGEVDRKQLDEVGIKLK